MPWISVFALRGLGHRNCGPRYSARDTGPLGEAKPAASGRGCETVRTCGNESVVIGPSGFAIQEARTGIGTWKFGRVGKSTAECLGRTAHVSVWTKRGALLHPEKPSDVEDDHSDIRL